MTARLGSNPSDIHTRNRALVLWLIATERSISRAELSRRTGLTKTTSSKIVSELMEEHILCEVAPEPAEAVLGRRPISLGICPDAPLICGLLIRRNLCSAVLGDVSGTVLARVDQAYAGDIDAEGLVTLLLGLVERLRGKNARRVLALGIAAVGPLDIEAQKLLSPPDFYGIADLPIAAILSEKTGLPAFLINDANAGALAEKLYGGARGLENFMYLHIMNGIGAGYVLRGNIYHGGTGQSGEIGHTSINFLGPKCGCGNAGCLEVYANLDNLNQHIRHMQGYLRLRSSLKPAGAPYAWAEIIDAAAEDNAYALSALDAFCLYVAQALANSLNLLDIAHVVVGYASGRPEDVLVRLLSGHLKRRLPPARAEGLSIVKSSFGGDAPLIGSIAVVAERLFSGKMAIEPGE